MSMKIIPGTFACLGLAVGVAVGTSASEAAAQERTPPEGCTCERDGWTVLGTPGANVFFQSRLPRAMMGVALESDPEGARVQQVTEGSPAEAAGLQEGDLIVEVDGHDLLEPLDGARERRFREDASLPTRRLMALAAEWEPGDMVDLVYLRDGEERTARVEVEERTALPQLSALTDRLRDLGDEMRFEAGPGRVRVFGMEPGEFSFGPGEFSFGEGFRFFRGLELRELDAELGRYFGAEGGVLVLSVDDDRELGLQAGDVILSLGGRSVDEPRDVYRILGSYEDGETVRWEILRDGEPRTVESEMR